MFKRSVIIISILVAGLAALSAWSITDTYFGNPFGVLDARGLAMGGTGIYNDMRPSAIVANPANLTLMNKKAGLQGNFFLNRNEDNRAVPLYNSFDNYIDDAVYASNINFYDDYAATGFISMKLWKLKLGLGAYYQPMLSFDGNYLEEIRNNRNTDNDGYPEKIAINTIDNTGLLNQASGVASVGFGIGEKVDVNLGLDVGMLFGDVYSEKNIRWTQWAIDTVGEYFLPSYNHYEHTDLDGMRLKGGVSVTINDNFGVGGTYSLKSILDRTGEWGTATSVPPDQVGGITMGTIDEDYILPTQIRLGLNYQPRNIMRTWFNLEGELVRFSELGTQYEDCLNFYAGVEHHVVNRLPLRLGFQATNGYLRTVEGDGAVIAKRILTPMLTAGSSVFLTDNILLDLGFGYSWREYEALDLFGDSYYDDRNYTGESSYLLWPNQYIVLTDRGWENPDKVRESNISFNTSLSIAW
jgi:hypothetical protein